MEGIIMFSSYDLPGRVICLRALHPLAIRDGFSECEVILSDISL